MKRIASKSIKKPIIRAVYARLTTAKRKAELERLLG